VLSSAVYNHLCLLLLLLVLKWVVTHMMPPLLLPPLLLLLLLPQLRNTVLAGAVQRLDKEPMFCFETAIKLFFWSCLVYEDYGGGVRPPSPPAGAAAAALTPHAAATSFVISYS